MPPKVDPKERLERERQRIRRRERTVELAGLGMVVSLTVLPFLLGKFTSSLTAFVLSMVALAACIGVALWAVHDRRQAVKQL